MYPRAGVIFQSIPDFSIYWPINFVINSVQKRNLSALECITSIFNNPFVYLAFFLRVIHTYIYLSYYSLYGTFSKLDRIISILPFYDNWHHELCILFRCSFSRLCATRKINAILSNSFPHVYNTYLTLYVHNVNDYLCEYGIYFFVFIMYYRIEEVSYTIKLHSCTRQSRRI